MKSLASVALVFAIAASCGGKTLDGDAGADAQADSGDGATCTYQDTRTSATRACKLPSECVVVPRAVSCCQEQQEGLRSDAAQKFTADQTALNAGCPGCGCAAQPVDDLGQKGTTFVATCDKGVCTSHAQ